MLKDKICITCGKTFTPHGPAGKYCHECPTPSKTKHYMAEAYNKYRKKLGCEVGVGSGNSSKNKGKTHPHYKNGWTSYFKLRKVVKDSIRFCEACGKDLLNASRYEWVCHHKDHNRENSAISNLQLLCKRCHQIEHKCWKAFEGATTISKESTPKPVEAPDNLKG